MAGKGKPGPVKGAASAKSGAKKAAAATKALYDARRGLGMPKRPAKGGA